MGCLVFHQLGGRSSNMYRLSVLHNGSCLHGKNFKLEGGHVGLIPIKRAYIGTLVEAGMGHISKSPMVQASPFQNPLLAFIRY
jgi:hypothetical protein